MSSQPRRRDAAAERAAIRAQADQAMADLDAVIRSIEASIERTRRVLAGEVLAMPADEGAAHE